MYSQKCRFYLWIWMLNKSENRIFSYYFIDIFVYETRTFDFLIKLVIIFTIYYTKLVKPVILFDFLCVEKEKYRLKMTKLNS